MFCSAKRLNKVLIAAYSITITQQESQNAIFGIAFRRKATNIIHFSVLSFQYSFPHCRRALALHEKPLFGTVSRHRVTQPLFCS